MVAEWPYLFAVCDCELTVFSVFEMIAFSVSELLVIFVIELVAGDKKE